MGDITWFEAVDIIRPHVVRIATPRVNGTGFLLSHSEGGGISGVATAAHVVDHAHYWEEPIRIDHPSSNQSLLVRHPNRAILLNQSRDIAAILFRPSNISFPANTLPLAPQDKFLRVGSDLGWLGFPAISTENLCFFGGRVSAWIQNEEAYLVDGVTINGVSGGPAFYIRSGEPVIMGVVSAYLPSHAAGEALPGLGVVRSVNRFHDIIAAFKSIDQAKAQETPPTTAPSRDQDAGLQIPTRGPT